MKVLCSLQTSARPEDFDPIGIIRNCQDLAIYFFIVCVGPKYHLKVYLRGDFESALLDSFRAKLFLTDGLEKIEQSGSLSIFKKEITGNNSNDENAIKARDELIGFVITADNDKEFTFIIENAVFEKREIKVPAYKKGE
jgi:hypothetical protein